MSFDRIEYIERVKIFNSYNFDKIIIPNNDSILKNLLQYTNDVIYHTELLQRYEDTLKKGYVDHRLETEIGLFVYDLNNKSIRT